VRLGRDADPLPTSSAEVKNRAFVAYERVKPTYTAKYKQRSKYLTCTPDDGTVVLKRSAE
jgi:hypothetical protein